MWRVGDTDGAASVRSRAGAWGPGCVRPAMLAAGGAGLLLPGHVGASCLCAFM